MVKNHIFIILHHIFIKPSSHLSKVYQQFFHNICQKSVNNSVNNSFNTSFKSLSTNCQQFFHDVFINIFHTSSSHLSKVYRQTMDHTSITILSTHLHQGLSPKSVNNSFTTSSSHLSKVYRQTMYDIFLNIFHHIITKPSPHHHQTFTILHHISVDLFLMKCY